jgi:hypothetical protein
MEPSTVEDIAFSIGRITKPFIKSIRRDNGTPEFRKTLTTHEVEKLLFEIHALAAYVLKHKDEICEKSNLQRPASA